MKDVKQKKAKGTMSWNETIVDLDMRESTLLDSVDKVEFPSIEVGQKFKGTVVRIEDYGVFVCIENSDFTGLVNKSECTDGYVKNASNLFDHGDLVKIIVQKKDND